MMSGKIVKTRNITQSAQGNKYGLWTSVVAAAVLVTDQMIVDYAAMQEAAQANSENSVKEGVPKDSTLKNSIKKPFSLARSVFGRKKEQKPKAVETHDTIPVKAGD